MCRAKRAKDKYQQVLIDKGIRQLVHVTGVVINAQGMFGKIVARNGARRRVRYVPGTCFQWVEV